MEAYWVIPVTWSVLAESLLWLVVALLTNILAFLHSASVFTTSLIASYGLSCTHRCSSFRPLQFLTFRCLFTDGVTLSLSMNSLQMREAGQIKKLWKNIQISVRWFKRESWIFRYIDDVNKDILNWTHLRGKGKSHITMRRNVKVTFSREKAFYYSDKIAW